MGCESIDCTAGDNKDAVILRMRLRFKISHPNSRCSGCAHRRSFALVDDLYEGVEVCTLNGLFGSSDESETDEPRCIEEISNYDSSDCLGYRPAVEVVEGGAVVVESRHCIAELESERREVVGDNA